MTEGEVCALFQIRPDFGSINSSLSLIGRQNHNDISPLNRIGHRHDLEPGLLP